MRLKPWVAINAQNAIIGNFFTESEAYAFCIGKGLAFFDVEYRPSARETK